MNDMLRGEMVRLTAEDPDLMAGYFSRWYQDTEWERLLDSDPTRLLSVKKWKEWLNKDLEKGGPDDVFFAIRTIKDDILIGFVALFNLYMQHGDTLVAIALGEREYWGNGYGTDAMRLMLRYAFNELNLRRVGLLVFEYNARAIRSYQKAGFTLEGRVRGAMQRDGQRWDFLYMGVLKEEWLASGVMTRES